MLSIREARGDEWPLWRDLRLRALADSPDAFGQTLADARTHDEAQWRSYVAPRSDATRLVAERDGAPVGMCVVVIADDQRAANVYAMWVAPEARGAGAGRALVEAALAWARSRAVLDVTSHVSDRHPAAKRLYLRCGFVATGERAPLRRGSEIQSDILVARLPPLVMGVVNVTPDSFSDGGSYLAPDAAIAHGLQLVRDGADILDIGGEATNPRATPVTADEELRRVLPVIERLAGAAPLSIDTTKASVARAAASAGASIVNDVSGGLFDRAMAETVGELDVTYIAGHLRGRSLADVFAAEGSVSWQTVAAELADRIATLPRGRVWVDPGIGFGKGGDPEGNVALLRHAGDIGATLRRPVVVGPSRKRFLRRLLGAARPGWPGLDVLDAASALASIAGLRAGAHVVRVHNVALLRTAWTAYNKE